MGSKRSYETPTLIEYGSIAERTQYYAGGCSPLDPSGGCPPKDKSFSAHTDFAGEWSATS
jgi:hypothetical protein